MASGSWPEPAHPHLRRPRIIDRVRPRGGDLFGRRSFIGRVAMRAQLPGRLDGTDWRWSVSVTEVRRDRGTTAVGAGYPPSIDLRSSARIVALFTVGFCRQVVAEPQVLGNSPARASSAFA